MTHPKFICALLAICQPGCLLAEANWALCLGIDDDRARLSCYDAQASGGVSTKFEGFGGQDLPAVRARAGDVLVYRNRDAVMVVSLMSDAGVLLENLHIGGAGLKRHEFEADGSYAIQVDATGAWAVWIETLPDGVP